QILHPRKRESDGRQRCWGSAEIAPFAGAGSALRCGAVAVMPHPQGEAPMSAFDRRQLLRGLSAAGAAAALGAAAPPRPDRDRIRNENAQPGPTDRQLTYTRVDPKTRFRSPLIEGYAARASVRPGQAIDFFVSTNPPSPVVRPLSPRLLPGQGRPAPDAP